MPERNAECQAAYDEGWNNCRHLFTLMEQDYAATRQRLTDHTTTIAALRHEIADLRSQLALATTNQLNIGNGNEAGNGTDRGADHGPHHGTADRNSRHGAGNDSTIGGSATGASSSRT